MRIDGLEGSDGGDSSREVIGRGWIVLLGGDCDCATSVLLGCSTDFSKFSSSRLR